MDRGLFTSNPLGGVACLGYICLPNASKRPAGRTAWGK